MGDALASGVICALCKKMLQPVSITFALTQDAYMRGCYQLWAHRALGRTGNFIVATIVVGCAVFLFWQGVPGPWAWIFLGAGVVFVGMDVMRDRIWRKHYQSLVKYTAPITAIFTDAGIGLTSKEATNIVPWQQFRDYVFTADYLFILIDQRNFSVIPLSAFETPAARAQAEALIADHLKPLKGRLF